MNYHAGLVYQITPEINVYASFGTAQDINGGESDVGNSSSYGGLQLDLQMRLRAAVASPKTVAEFRDRHQVEPVRRSFPGDGWPCSRPPSMT